MHNPPRTICKLEVMITNAVAAFKIRIHGINHQDKLSTRFAAEEEKKATGRVMIFPCQLALPQTRKGLRGSEALSPIGTMCRRHWAGNPALPQGVFQASCLCDVRPAHGEKRLDNLRPFSKVTSLLSDLHLRIILGSILQILHI